VALVHQHHRFEAPGSAEQLQTLCVAYASAILGYSLPATSLPTDKLDLIKIHVEKL
jgi:hypothetical protein